MQNRIYIAIDLKSFYASVECRERGLDPLTTNLVVADESRTDKTICLAVTPSLKSYGVPGRPRLYEVIQKVRMINVRRQMQIPNRTFVGKSYDNNALKKNPKLELDYIVASPRMSIYMAYSARIYSIYLKYISPEDIHVYSVDEVFMDVTPYLNYYKKLPHELARIMIYDVLNTTGITATVGIGTNLYLAKVAMDIKAKHLPPDEYGVRIAELNEISYRKGLWLHQPLTDFWRVGRGYAKRLHAHGLYTMGEIAKCSMGTEKEYYSECLLYKIFGINAELLIDHAWGWEPCTISDIKKYKPETRSLSSSQVLHHPYSYEKARLIAAEMADSLILDMVDKDVITNQLSLTVVYDSSSFNNSANNHNYTGKIVKDHYGNAVPKPAHGTINLDYSTSSSQIITPSILSLFDQIVLKNFYARMINITANNIIPDEGIDTMFDVESEQLDFFTDYSALEQEKARAIEVLTKEKNMQKAVLNIKKKYGKNAIIKGMNLEEGATAMERNTQIGGHKA